MRGNHLFGAAALAVACSGSSALATYSISLSGAAAPTYATTLTFDEVGGPTGVVPANSWAGIGLADMQAGDGVPFVGDNDTPNGGWGLGTGNSFFGNFGVFMTFDSGLDAMSFQVWDPSGPPSPFGGGAIVALFNDGVDLNEVFSFEPAWGGIGDTWINITATGGMEFDEVRVLGFGFPAFTHVDNLSWNTVPGPSAAIVLALGGFGAARRRR